MAHRAVTIYALVDPRTGGVRYVGQTVKPLPSRLRGHLRGAQQQPDRTVKTRWIAELVSQGLSPSICSLCVMPLRGRKQTPEHIAKRVTARMQTLLLSNSVAEAC